MVNKREERRLTLTVAENGRNYSKAQIYAKRQAERPLGEAMLGEWSDLIYDTYNLDGTKTPVVYKIDKSRQKDGQDLYDPHVETDGHGCGSADGPAG